MEVVLSHLGQAFPEIENGDVQLSFYIDDRGFKNISIFPRGDEMVTYQIPDAGKTEWNGYTFVLTEIRRTALVAPIDPNTGEAGTPVPTTQGVFKVTGGTILDSEQ